MSREIRECCMGGDALEVIREGGTITVKRAKLLGERSRNPPPDNHEYPRSTREKAVRIMEGQGVFVDHGPRGSREGRSYRDRMGVVRNVMEGGDGCYGDWSFPAAHPLAEQAAWDAVHAPENLGFSIRGNGDKRREGGRVIVESITDLDSIDLVSRPATTSGLREELTVKKTCKQLIEQLKPSRPGYARALREMADSGVLSDDAAMAEPVPPPAEVSEAADHKKALRDACKMILDDESLSEAEILKKIKGVLKLIKGTAGASEPDEPDTKTEESHKKKPSNLREQLELSALRQLGKKGVKLTPLIERAVRGCESDADVTALVESLAAEPERPGAKSAGQGGTSGRLQESQTAAGQTGHTATETNEQYRARVQALRAIR